MHEKQKVEQAKARRHQQTQRLMKYGGDAVSLLTKVNGMRSAAPSTQFNHLLGISGLALSAGSSLLKATADSKAGAAGSLPSASQQPTVNNNFFLSDETIARLQDEQAQLQPEYEDTESVNFPPQGQQEDLANNQYGHGYGQSAHTDNSGAIYDYQPQLEAEQLRSFLSSLSVEDQRNLVNFMSYEEQQ
jgi:hypothetical protein